jgi:hypothetical protein
MGVLVDKFLAAGIQLEPTGDGNVRARGTLTDDLRAAIRANKRDLLAELAAANEAHLDAPSDVGTERRRTRALALLSEHPGWHRAVILEAGRPPILGMAIRGVAYGEMELPSDYDPALLLALLEQHGAKTQ